MFNLMNTQLGDVLHKAKNELLMRTIWLEVFRDKAFQQIILEWIQQDQLSKKEWMKIMKSSDITPNGQR